MVQIFKIQPLDNFQKREYNIDRKLKVCKNRESEMAKRTEFQKAVKKAVEASTEVFTDKIICKADGSLELKRAYFYTHGMTGDKWAHKVYQVLRGAGFQVDVCGYDRMATWPKDSYFVAVVKDMMPVNPAWKEEISDRPGHLCIVCDKPVADDEGREAVDGLVHYGKCEERIEEPAPVRSAGYLRWLGVA